jgi:hypothetical protein
LKAKMGALERWIADMPERERQRRLKDAQECELMVEACIEAGKRRLARRDPARDMLAELDARMIELKRTAADNASKRAAACEILAKHLCAYYRMAHTDADTAAVLAAVDKYGPKIVRDTAVQLRRQPYDSTVANLWAVLAARAKRTAGVQP